MVGTVHVEYRIYPTLWVVHQILYFFEHTDIYLYLDFVFCPVGANLLHMHVTAVGRKNNQCCFSFSGNETTKRWSLFSYKTKIQGERRGDGIMYVLHARGVKTCGPRAVERPSIPPQCGGTNCRGITALFRFLFRSRHLARSKPWLA